jgi:hypothetical protein
MKRFVLLSLAAAVLPQLAEAQACLGLASLASAPTNVTVSALFGDGAKGIDGRFGFGSSIAFGGISASIVDFDDVDGTAKTIGGDVGLSYLVGTAKKMSFCPVGSLSYTMYPDIEFLGESSSSNDVTGTAGLALGGTVSTSSAISLIPFASVRAAYTRFSVDIAGESESDSETYGLLSGGVSLALNSSVLIRPVITIPFGLDGSDPTYGIGVSFALGRRK